MDTRERLVRYRDLRRADPEAAARFLEENRRDERFVSLARLGTTFIDGFRACLDRWRAGTTRRRHE